jgi:hypothetical protein
VARCISSSSCCLCRCLRYSLLCTFLEHLFVLQPLFLLTAAPVMGLCSVPARYHYVRILWMHLVGPQSSLPC